MTSRYVREYALRDLVERLDEALTLLELEDSLDPPDLCRIESALAHAANYLDGLSTEEHDSEQR